jgi:hypothetical protein
MATKKKLTKKRILKGGNPVRESPIQYRIPKAHEKLQNWFDKKALEFGGNKSAVITQALEYRRFNELV